MVVTFSQGEKFLPSDRINIALDMRLVKLFVDDIYVSDEKLTGTGRMFFTAQRYSPVLNDIAAANYMTVVGTHQYWQFDLTGSALAMKALKDCSERT